MQFLPGISLLNILMTSHLLTFLKNINTFFRPMSSNIFGIHDPVGLRYLFQLRVSLSPLRSHKFRHNFTDTPSEICRCNQGIEDTNHFFLSCPNYVTQRATLTTSVINILQKNNLKLFRKSIETVLIWASIN